MYNKLFSVNITKDGKECHSDEYTYTCISWQVCSLTPIIIFLCRNWMVALGSRIHKIKPRACVWKTSKILKALRVYKKVDTKLDFNAILRKSLFKKKLFCFVFNLKSNACDDVFYEMFLFGTQISSHFNIAWDKIKKNFNAWKWQFS